MDRNDHKLELHRIPTNTPQKVITSNRSPRTSRRTLYWESKREKKPSSYCLRTRRSVVNYSRIIGGAPMRMMNPSVIVFPSDKVPERASRLDLVVLELAAAWIVFRGLPCNLYNIWVFIELRGGGRDSCGPHYPPGHTRGLWRPGVSWALWASPLVLPSFPSCLLGRKNLQKVSLRLDSVWYGYCANTSKNSN